MNLAFINIQLRPESPERILPTGLAYILTAVHNAGYNFDLIDMDINNYSLIDLEDILKQNNYDIFAFGTLSSSFKIVKSIAAIIRKINPNAIIIAGNSVASSIYEITLRNTEVDITISGEGDVTIVKLIDAITNNKNINSIKGIAYLKNGSIIKTTERPVVRNIDNIGFPKWDLFDLKKYFLFNKSQVYSETSSDMKVIPLNTGRGCPYKCTFCYITVRDKKYRYRRYSEDMIIQEIKRLHYEYDVNYIQFWDDLTFPNVKAAEKMAEMIIELDFDIKWTAPIRGDLITEKNRKVVEKLKKSGCDYLAFSLESGNNEILKTMKKNLRIDQFIEQAHILRSENITPYTSIVLGYPEETPESIRETADVCEKAKIYPSVGFLLPLPGTEIYQWAKENGKIQDEYKYLMSLGDRQDLHINLTNMSDEEFYSEVESRFKKLADKLDVKVDSVFKTSGYKKVDKVKLN